MVDVQVVQEADQTAPMAFLYRLSTIVAETQMHGSFNLYAVEHEIQCARRYRGIRRITRNVGFIQLDAVAREVHNLGSHHLGDQGRLRADLYAGRGEICGDLDDRFQEICIGTD